MFIFTIVKRSADQHKLPNATMEQLSTEINAKRSPSYSLVDLSMAYHLVRCLSLDLQGGIGRAFKTRLPCCFSFWNPTTQPLTKTRISITGEIIVIFIFLHSKKGSAYSQKKT